MASGGSNGLRVGVVAAVGCVVVAVILTAAGTLSGGRHGNLATSGKGSVPTTVTPSAPDVEGDGADPAIDPEASPEATSSEPDLAATPPAVLPTDALPTEVAQSLADLADQLSQAGDDGRPPEMTREEVTALLNAQLQALGIQL